MVHTAQSNFIKYEIASQIRKKKSLYTKHYFSNFCVKYAYEKKQSLPCENFEYIFVMGKKFQCNIWHIRIGIEIHFIFHFIIVWDFF